MMKKKNKMGYKSRIFCKIELHNMTCCILRVKKLLYRERDLDQLVEEVRAKAGLPR